MNPDGAVRLRQRLRRLVQTVNRLAQKSEEEKKSLSKSMAKSAAAIAMLNVYTGPQSAELFRLSFQPAKAELRRAEISGVECVQFVRNSGAGGGFLPRYTSLLTSPQSEKSSRQVEETAECLWNYINAVLAQRAAERLCRRLRRELRREESESARVRGVEAARRAAREQNFEAERRRWRRARDENSGHGARPAP